MTGIVLSALLLTAAGDVTASPAPATTVVAPNSPSPTPLADARDRLRLPTDLTSSGPRSVWRSESAASAQPTARRSSSIGTRILGVALGAVGGFYAGGAIGYALTQDRNNPNDDGVSGLRGVVIGAPIGAAVGGLIGLTLTK